MTTDEFLHEVEPSIGDAVAISHPGVVFTNIWLQPCTSWCGSDMVDVWAVYEGDIADLRAPAKPSLATRIQDILWDMGVDASPGTHLVAKADAKDVSPETSDVRRLGRVLDPVRQCGLHHRVGHVRLLRRVVAEVGRWRAAVQSSLPPRVLLASPEMPSQRAIDGMAAL